MAKSTDKKEMTVGNHSLGWSFIVGQLAFAEGQSGSPGVDKRMRRLGEATKAQHRVYLEHIRSRDAGFEAASKLSTAMRVEERPVRYDIPAKPRAGHKKSK